MKWRNKIFSITLIASLASGISAIALVGCGNKPKQESKLTATWPSQGQIVSGTPSQLPEPIKLTFFDAAKGTSTKVTDLCVYAVNGESKESFSVEILGENHDGYLCYNGRAIEADNISITITATYTDYASTKEFTITSQPITINVSHPIVVDSVTIQNKISSLHTGSTHDLVVKVLPEQAPQTVTFSSSDPEVASVSENGKITALKDGTTTIKATSFDGKKSDEFNLSVTSEVIHVTGVSLTEHDITIDTADQPHQLVANIQPDNATDKKLIWTSNNEEVAKVDQNGLVTPISSDIANIVVKTNDGDFYDSCTVTVTGNKTIQFEKIDSFSGIVDGTSGHSKSQIKALYNDGTGQTGLIDVTRDCEFKFFDNVTKKELNYLEIFYDEKDDKSYIGWKEDAVPINRLVDEGIKIIATYKTHTEEEVTGESKPVNFALTGKQFTTSVALTEESKKQDIFFITEPPPKPSYLTDFTFQLCTKKQGYDIDISSITIDGSEISTEDYYVKSFTDLVFTVTIKAELIKNDVPIIVDATLNEGMHVYRYLDTDGLFGESNPATTTNKSVQLIKEKQYTFNCCFDYLPETGSASRRIAENILSKKSALAWKFSLSREYDHPTESPLKYEDIVDLYVITSKGNKINLRINVDYVITNGIIESIDSFDTRGPIVNIGDLVCITFKISDSSWDERSDVWPYFFANNP